MRTPFIVSTAVALVIGLNGCSMLEDKKIDYKSQGDARPGLEVPPDLILPSNDTRFTVPGAVAKGSATLSEFDRTRAAGKAGDSQGGLLPDVDKVRIERAGNQRWLVAQVSSKEAWSTAKDFWQELGFIINVETPEAGVMETDWAENRAKIPQEGIRKWLGKAMDTAYSTSERDKFRTRLEPSADGKSTEIYISHRGMVEVYDGTQNGGDQGKGRTIWQPRPDDPQLEAEMLRRLMVRLGMEEKRAQKQVAEKIAPPQAALAGGEQTLNLNEAFDRAWRRVGLALDRIGFVVEDRDRNAGLYFVRYADTEAASAKKGLLDKMAFWRSDDKMQLAQKYRVRLTSQGETSQVVVLNDKGEAVKNETSQRILRLLLEQLK